MQKGSFLTISESCPMTTVKDKLPRTSVLIHIHPEGHIWINTSVFGIYLLLKIDVPTKTLVSKRKMHFLYFLIELISCQMSEKTQWCWFPLSPYVDFFERLSKSPNVCKINLKPTWNLLNCKFFSQYNTLLFIYLFVYLFIYLFICFLHLLHTLCY